ncbi:hypothetical protein [uncultured Psychroserpens sp.]|uniref:hypothetical protein n=1 Tax=uncultured Psychroserpens sp. TaxID=255436 RepID=UPI00260E7C01|nr:hypothetical protein [uncultured Psychroserpens sp.]
MVKKSICIFTQSPLTKAPRVVKEANVYAEAGFSVTVYGLWYDKALLENDRALLHSEIIYKAGINLLDYNSFRSKIIRLKRKTARELVKYLNIETINALGYNYKYYLKQLEQEQSCIYIGHEEMSMALSKALLEKGFKVAFDFEDWHSKDLLPEDRVYRPIKLLERLEAYLLEKATYCYTTSEAMSKAMVSYYNTSRRPKVVYNSFLASDRELIDGLNKDIIDQNLPSVFWFSQVISEGRGLELLFDALSYCKVSFQLHLRGEVSRDFKAKLISKTPKEIELYFHDLVLPNQLISRIAEHDIGIAFESTEPKSRNYTITNKVFHYLQSGIAILATETAGQKEIEAKAPEAILLIERDSKEIAKALDRLLSDANRLELMKTSSREAGKHNFAFESSKEQLLHMLNEEFDI